MTKLSFNAILKVVIINVYRIFQFLIVGITLQRKLVLSYCGPQKVKDRVDDYHKLSYISDILNIVTETFYVDLRQFKD